MNNVKSVENESLILNSLVTNGSIEEIMNLNLASQETSFMIGEVAEVFEGISVNPKYLQTDEDIKGISYIKPSSIKYWELLKGKYYIKEEFANKYDKKLLKVGDILISKIFDGYNCAIVRDERLKAIASKNVIIIRCTKMNPQILFNAIAFNEGKQIFLKSIKERGRGYDIKYINKEIINGIRLPYKI
ncbi:hypothetical protein [Clostridium cavendishii]|nr:hypothetical protein [Clostridium cavendishii]